MAKNSETAVKEPGRFAQLVDVFKMVAKYDKPGVALMIAAFLVPIIAAVLLCVFSFGNNVILWIMFIVLGVLVGFMLFMMVMNWRAERVAFSQLEGRAGATGAVLQSSLRGQWRTSDTPVAFNPRTQDVVFRAIGKPGIVLFTESNGSAATKLLKDEQRKVQRAVPNVPVHHILVGEHGVKLANLRREVKRLPNKIRKAEILAIDTRLASLQKQNLPIPKGIDPNKMRSSRSHLR